MTRRTGEATGSARATRSSARALAGSAASRRRARGEARTRSVCRRPGKQRSLATVGHHRSSSARRESRSAIAPCARVSAVDGGDQVSEHQLADSLLELLSREPAPVSHRPGRGLRIDPAVTQQHLRDPVTGGHQIPVGTRREQRVSSRAASTSTGGTTTLVNEPASSRRASSSASLRSVFTRSDGPLGVLPGAITSSSIPGRARRAVEPEPGRPGLIARTHRAGQTLQATRPAPRHPARTAHASSSPVDDVDRRSVRRAGMDIEPHTRHRSGHGRTSSSIWGQPEPFSGQTNPREERPATQPGRQPCNAPPAPPARLPPARLRAVFLLRPRSWPAHASSAPRPAVRRSPPRRVCFAQPDQQESGPVARCFVTRQLPGPALDRLR